jgi:hypothetical protein
MLKIGIDIDDCITYCPDFFKAMTNSMNDLSEIALKLSWKPWIFENSLIFYSIRVSAA